MVASRDQKKKKGLKEGFTTTGNWIFWIVVIIIVILIIYLLCRKKDTTTVTSYTTVPAQLTGGNWASMFSQLQ